MAAVESQLEDWKGAYRVPGVPLSATSLSIGEAYRRLLKRWHPDLVPSGSSQHAEAT
jgi:curved DNA-binding protein CbpA